MNVYDGIRAHIVRENVKRVKDRVAKAAYKSGRHIRDIQIMAVTKTVPAELVNIAISEGITLLGENRIQEYISKKKQYDPIATVDFIGQLQRNKIKYIDQKIRMIHSIDSEEMIKKLDKRMKEIKKTIEILIQVNIGNELNKGGVQCNEMVEIIKKINKYENISIKGFMCIPPVGQSDYFFAKMNDLVVDIMSKNIDNINESILSMGMSNDFESAIRYGSNLVRLGTVLFGTR